MSIKRNIGAAIGITRSLDGVYLVMVLEADFLRDVFPFTAAVAGDPQRPVIGANPKDFCIARGFGQRSRSTTIGAAYLRRDDLQLVATVQGAKHEVACVVINPRVVVREQERRLPVESRFFAARRGCL